MSWNSQALCLCNLIEHRLGPYTGREIIIRSREDEKKLLNTLSQVLRQVQLWTCKLDCCSSDGVDSKSSANYENLGEFDLRSRKCRCIRNIVCNTMVFLNVGSKHVQHVTGNLLLAISGIFSAYESNWCLFIYMLFFCAESSLSHIFSHSALGCEGSKCKLHSDILVMKPWLQNVSWVAVVQIARVLRYIWKDLKQENDDNLVQVYLDSLNSFLSSFPLHLLDEFYVGQNGDHQKSYGSDTLSFKSCQQPGVIFLGYLVQLLCSVIEQIVPVEVQAGSLDSHPVLCTINDLLSKLCHWCLCREEDQANACLSMYFRHKLLMLMIRLSTASDAQYSNFGSWLQLLNMYFQEFLWDQAVQVEPLGNSSLEGSPFASVMLDDEVHLLSIPHILRQATYLFLRCSFGLISTVGEIDKQCNCMPPRLGLNLAVEFCCHERGLMELNQWLRKNFITGDLHHCELYKGKCIGFVSSFLQFYMLEDDLLFKVLLQMLSLPLCVNQELHKEGRISDVEEDLPFLVSTVFNPITIFHIFLAEIHYDHKVLLDYLISKDTGISAAQHLLRSLRIICDNFQQFLEYQSDNAKEEPPPKKRKPSSKGRNVLAHQSSSSSHDKNSERDCIYGFKNPKIDGQPFEEAKSCLISLKDSLESLYKKNLFPYNPTALLKRLMEFQKLCYDRQYPF